MMQIGELARRSGLSASRIRFYEAQGLINVCRQANGYRSYSGETLVALNIITSAQGAGFSLDEIRRLVANDLSNCREGTLLAALRDKLGDIRAMEARLRRTRRALEALIDDIGNRPAGLTCEENTSRLLKSFRAQPAL